MKVEAHPPSKVNNERTYLPVWLVRLLGGLALAASLLTTPAAPKLSAESPLGFFTNTASALFQKQNFRDDNGNLITVTNIPVWPVNYYAPTMHRLLQVTANIYECTTNGLYPCIYRPLFAAQGTNLFIRGFELVNGPDNAPTAPTFLTLPLDLNDPAARATIGTTPTPKNIYGLPWIIGAKKGFPNLNQIAMQSVSQMTRKLLVSRPTTRSGWTGYHSKQMFVVGISNSLAVEIWNSYNTTYPRPLYIQADCQLTLQLTNDLGYTPAPVTFNLGGAIMGATNLPAGSLINSGLRPPLTPAYTQPRAQSFVVPLLTNLIVLPDSVQIGAAMFPANDSPALWNSLPWDNLTQPHWGLNIMNNLRCLVMDGGVGGRVVDYVQLSRLDSTRDLTQESLSSSANRWDVWTLTTNTTAYWATPASPMSQGILQQLQISQGSVATSAADWADNGLPTANRTGLIASFISFLTSSVVSSNTMQAPFTPTTKIRQMLKWQANDPLVHYLTEDLTYLDGAPNDLVVPPNSTSIPKVTESMYRFNERFSPWGGNGPKTGWNPQSSGDPHLFDTALKDPLVMVSDNWNFPSNQPLNFNWIGQVHRGTPWQTLYLKSADILSTDLNAWRKWSGSANAYVATNLAPFNDRLLVGVLISLLNTNDQRLSINNPSTNAWLGVMDGFIVQTNDPIQAVLNSIVMSSNSPAAGLVVQGIVRARQAQAGGYFHRVSDLLTVPELSDVSPYLVTNTLRQITAGGITDEALEKIPTQLLPLLHVDSIGALSFANGSLLLQFTGDDNYSYAVEASTNLVNWVRLTTNQPTNGVFNFGPVAPVNIGQQFYRSVLLP